MIHENFGMPYYAVIFTSTLTGKKLKLYEQLNSELTEEIKKITGYLGHDSARAEVGITVVYFRDKEAINTWKYHQRHGEAKKLGVSDFYSAYHIRICLVEQEHGFKL